MVIYHRQVAPVLLLVELEEHHVLLVLKLMLLDREHINSLMHLFDMIQLCAFLHDLREQHLVLKLFLYPLVKRLLTPPHLLAPLFEVLLAVILPPPYLIYAGLNLHIPPCLQSMLAELLQAHLELLGGATTLLAPLMDHLQEVVMLLPICRISLEGVSLEVLEGGSRGQVGFERGLGLAGGRRT